MRLSSSTLAPIQEALLLLLVLVNSCNALVFSISENVPRGTYVGTLFQDARGLSSFQFNGQGCSSYFTIGPSDSVISTSPSNLDREVVVVEQGTDTLSCIVQYSNGPTITQLQFTITVLDQNDVAPRFQNMNKTTVLSLPQSLPVGNSILLLQPVDPDKGLNGTVSCSIVPSSDSSTFRMDRIGGSADSNFLLYLNRSLTKAMYNISILLSDMGTPPLTFVQTIIVQVQSYDNVQVTFVSSRIDVLVNEKYPIGKVFRSLPTSPPNLTLSYQVASSGSQAASSDLCCGVYPNGGLYFIRTMDVDRNAGDQEVQVTVSVSGANGITASCIVTITVMDINDNAPYVVIGAFQDQPTPPFHITQGFGADQLLHFLIDVRDSDRANPNNQITAVNVTVDPPIDTLTLTATRVPDSTYYIVKVGGIINAKVPSLTMNIFAMDGGTPPQIGRLSYPINVDGPPQFPLMNATALTEGAPIGKSVLTVTATGVEQGPNTYQIISIDKAAASNWFSIDQSTGVISVASSLNRSAVNGTVTLNVSAVNAATPPLNSSTSVTITIPPPIVSFSPMSYQYHSGYSIIDLVMQGAGVYMEFYVLKDGPLLWQEKSDRTLFVLEIVNHFAQASLGGQLMAKSSTAVMHEMWYSLLLVNRSSTMLLQVWPWDHSDNQTEAMLMGAQLQCSAQPSNLSSSGIFIGRPQSSVYSGFVGSLRNVILGSTQLDLTCPTASVNTSIGPLSDLSTCALSSCSGSSWCLNVKSKQICGFSGGFVLTSSQMATAFDPVGFTGNSWMDITLDANFFVDISKTTPALPGTVLQEISLSFQPMSLNGSGLLLQSKTANSIHILKFVSGDGQTSLVYQVDTITQSTQSTSILVSQSVQINMGSTYIVTIQISSTRVTVSYNTQSQSGTWVSGHAASLFATPPSTLVVLGTLLDQANGMQYTGCIRSLSINGIAVPLTGLLASNGYSKVTPSANVFPSCSGCSSNLPPVCNATSSSCVEGLSGSVVCKCLPGFSPMANGSKCASLGGDGDPAATATSPSTLQSGLQTHLDQKFPLVAIIGAVAGVLVIMILVVVVAIVVFRCKMQKIVKQRTYSVTPEPNYDPKFSPKRSLSLKSQHSQQGGDSSDASSQPAPIEMSDRHSDTNNADGGCPPPHPTELTRTKSVNSAETGFNTCSERDDRSVPRTVEETPKEASFSQLETGSEDTSCMEEILSPAGVNLVGSMSQNLGITYQPVLTETEKKILTPLRPGPEEPLSLTVSEYAGDISDRPTYYNYRLRPPFSTLQSMPEGHEVPSRSTPPWYTSNVSDSETEDARRTAEEDGRRSRTEEARRKSSGSVPKVASMPPRMMANEMTAAGASAAATTPPPAREGAPSRCQRYRLHSADSPLVHSHSYKYGRQNSSRSAYGRRGLSPLELSSEGSESYSYTTPRHARHCSPLYFDTEADYSTRCVTAPRSAGPYGHQEFKDLKSVSHINPISYWEMQSRMKTTVDQDPYPLSHMEDASTQTNSDVFTDPLNVDFSHEHNTTDMMLSSVADLTPNCHTNTTTKVIPPAVPLGNDDDDDDYDDKPEMGPTHFPSADCSEEYGRKSSGGTLLATQSDDDSTQLSLSSDCSPAHPQMSFDT